MEIKVGINTNSTNAPAIKAGILNLKAMLSISFL
jgi:hypothetical protein